MQQSKTRLGSYASTVALLVFLPIVTLLIRGFLVSNGFLPDKQPQTEERSLVSGESQVPPDWDPMDDRFRLVDRMDIAQAIQQWTLAKGRVAALEIYSPPLEFAFFVDGELQEGWLRVDFEEQLGNLTGNSHVSMPYRVLIRNEWDFSDPKAQPKFYARITTQASVFSDGLKRRVREVQTLESLVTVPTPDVQRTETGKIRVARTMNLEMVPQRSEEFNSDASDSFEEELEKTGELRIFRARFNKGLGEKERLLELVVRPVIPG